MFELLILLNLRLKLGILFLKSVLLSKNLWSLVVPSHAVDFVKALFVGLELLVIRIDGIIQLVDALAAILSCFIPCTSNSHNRANSNGDGGNVRGSESCRCTGKLELFKELLEDCQSSKHRARHKTDLNYGCAKLVVEHTQRTIGQIQNSADQLIVNDVVGKVLECRLDCRSLSLKAFHIGGILFDC